MNNVLKTIKPFVAKHEPELLMAMGITGMIFSVAWGIKATVKAVHRLDDKRIREQKDELSNKEVFAETWRLYLPVVISVGISIPCIVAGNRVANRRNLALAAAYTISESALQEYQEKTKEIVGAKKEQEIHEAVSKDVVEKTYKSSQVLITGDGDSLFHEPLSGRYFKSNWNKILRAANELNAEALSDPFGSITLSDWYNKLGLDSTDISDDIGWTIQNGTSGLIDIQIDSILTPNDNVPCGSIYYNNRPKPVK